MHLLSGGKQSRNILFSFEKKKKKTWRIDNKLGLLTAALHVPDRDVSLSFFIFDALVIYTDPGTI